MTAFVANTSADYYFDSYTGGSTNATLDTYTISERARLIRNNDDALAMILIYWGFEDEA